MDRAWLWDRKISLAQVKDILQRDEHPRFIEFAGLLLTRKNIPKEVFKEYIPPLNFCCNWQKIKRKMRKDNWNNPRIEFWQAIYEKLREKYERNGIKVNPEKKGVQPVNDLAMQIAVKIIKKRKEKGLTQQELAQKAGFSQQMISHIEKGRQNISLLTLKKIVGSLGSKINLELID